MALALMDVFFKLATQKLDAITLFQAISGAKNSSLGRDGMDVIFKLPTSHKLVMITFPSIFRF